MYIKLDNTELEFLRLALNEAMDNTSNKARYKMYERLLDKVSKDTERELLDVMKGNKCLWHIQNMNISHNGEPYDLFLWSEHEPTEEQLRKAFLNDYEHCEDWQLEEWMTSSEMYKVWAEEI